MVAVVVVVVAVVVVYQRAWRKRSNAGFLWRGLDSNLRGINIIKGGKCMQEGEMNRGGGRSRG